MALSLSATARDRLTSLLICCSLGNLIFLRRWYDLEHLLARSVDYYRTGPPDPTLLQATLISASILTLVFWVAWLWVQRSQSRTLLRVARCAFLLAMIFPLESIRIYWNEMLNRFDFPSNIALILLELILVSGLVMVMRGNLRILRAARRVALLFTFLFPPLILDIAWSHEGAEPASMFEPKQPLKLLARGAKPRRRFLWVLFDEFDQRLAFDQRPASVQLPQLDRLRTESVVAVNAQQTGPWTIMALPSLLSGRIYSRAELQDARTLEIFPQGSQKGLDWAAQPNVFTRARKLRVNTELVGWHHPYCRVIGDSLTRCLDVTSGHPTAALLRETSAAEEGLARTVLFLFRMQLENLRDMLRPAGQSGSEKLRSAYAQGRQQRQYFKIRDSAYGEAVDPNIDFLFVHFPTPHPFAIYDRQRNDFTLNANTSYLDNLALVDRTVGELRSALERAGLWESTNLLITSDHGLRPDMWRGEYNWTPEMDRLTAAGQSETVPFILKLAGTHEALSYRRSFSSVIEGDIALAILSGDISTPRQVISFLDAHAEYAPSAGTHETELLGQEP